MPGVEINWWAIVAAAVLNVAAGSMWFAFAGKPSRKLTAKRAGQIAGDQTVWFIFLCSLAQAWILVHFVRYAGSLTFWQGAVTGFWLWLGLVAIAALIQHLFEGRSNRSWQTGIVFFLIILVVDSGLLAAWR